MLTLRSEVRLPASPEEIWPFFADARNLELLTPWLLRFAVITPAPIEMRAGTVIDYDLRKIFRFREKKLRQIFASDGPK